MKNKTCMHDIPKIFKKAIQCKTSLTRHLQLNTVLVYKHCRLKLYINWNLRDVRGHIFFHTSFQLCYNDVFCILRSGADSAAFTMTAYDRESKMKKYKVHAFSAFVNQKHPEEVAWPLKQPKPHTTHLL